MHEAKYSRMEQLIFFKDCLPQILGFSFMYFFFGLLFLIFLPRLPPFSLEGTDFRKNTV